MEDRKELMIPPNGGVPILRDARFLIPSHQQTSSTGAVPSLPTQAVIHNPSSIATGTGAVQGPRPFKLIFTGWTTTPHGWDSWVDRMYAVHRVTWMRAGICDAVLSSKFRIRREEDMILRFAERWCPETNTFVFPWGEATITLEDMVVLGGFSVLGCSALTQIEEGTPYDEILQQLKCEREEVRRTKAKKVSFGAWLTHFSVSGDEIEHEAFLCYWLSKFVFPVSAKETMGENVLHLAVLLARGVRVALAPAVLADTYGNLRELKNLLEHTRSAARARRVEDGLLELVVLGPTHLLQIWIWERFVNLRPQPNAIGADQPRMAMWHDVSPTSNIDYRVEIDAAGEYFRWRPYGMNVRKYVHNFYVDNVYVYVGGGGDELQEDEEAWIKCVRVSEIVGLNRDDNNTIEQYSPHRVAMQFGLDQDLPGLVPRASSCPEEAWLNYNRPVELSNYYLPPRLYESEVTQRYHHWWWQNNAPPSVSSQEPDGGGAGTSSTTTTPPAAGDDDLETWFEDSRPIPS